MSTALGRPFEVQLGFVVEPTQPHLGLVAETRDSQLMISPEVLLLQCLI
jgi:hypothetical protein